MGKEPTALWQDYPVERVAIRDISVENFSTLSMKPSEYSSTQNPEGGEK
jgi:hypothetical protein